MTTEQCGIASHEESCLCDVRPAKSVMVSKDAVFDMWQGERIAEILGHVKGREWTNDTILEYLETLLYVHDLWVEYGGIYYANESDIIPLQFPEFYNSLQKWKLIRDSVMAAAHQHPTLHVIDILKRLNVSLEQFICAVSINKHKHVMTEEQFRNFSEAMIVAKPRGYAGIARLFQTGNTTMTYWKKLFRVSRDIKKLNNGKVY
jgi:hypothetical protein